MAYAALNNFPNTCKILLESGADPNHPLIKLPLLNEITLTSEIETRNKPQLLALLVRFGASLDAADEEGHTALICAASDGNEELVNCFLQCGANIESTDKRGRTALHHAVLALNNSEAVVKILLSHDCEVDRADSQLLTPLLLAMDTNVNTLRLLLEKGASPDTPFERGYTPLMLTAWTGRVEFTRALLEHNAQVNFRIGEDSSFAPGFSATTYAAYFGHAEVLQTLADFGASLSQPTKSGSMPINLVKDVATLRVMLQHRKRFDLNHQDEDGNTLLHESVRRGDGSHDLVKLLINSGASLNIQNGNGLTPLTIAARNNDKDIVQSLLAETDIDLNIQSVRYGGPLQQAAVNSNFDILKMLVEAGADLNHSGAGYYGTPLQMASMEWSPRCGQEMVEYLIKNGAEVTGQGGALGSPLSAAAHRGTPEIVGLLLDKGASTNVCDAWGRMPIHFSTSNYDRFQLVLEAGGNVKAKDRLGWTPLHWAARAGQPKVIDDILSEVGSDAVDEPDIDGWTPLLWAVRACKSAHHEESIRLLLRNGATRSVRGQIGEQTWSLQRVAAYSAVADDVRTLLKKGLSDDTDECDKSWASDCEVEGLQATAEKDYFCDVCFWVSPAFPSPSTLPTLSLLPSDTNAKLPVFPQDVRGLVYRCETCFVVLCNKCYVHRDMLHFGSCLGKSFKEIGPEFEHKPSEQPTSEQSAEDEASVDSSSSDSYSD